MAVNTAQVDMSRTGGVYVPPFRLKQMMQTMDKSGAEYQKLMWVALKKSLNGVVNKVNSQNLRNMMEEIFRENLVWGMGLFCRAVMRAQAASPIFTNVFAALVAIINTKIPEVGDLIVKRVIAHFKKAYARNDKAMLMSLAKFLAHFVNQKVVHEVIGLELMILLLDKPTHDSVEVSVAFFKAAGKTLQEIAPKGFLVVQERLRSIASEESTLEPRTQNRIMSLFDVIKSNFADYPDVIEELDLVEEEDQITHQLSLDETYDVRQNLDFFKFREDFVEMQQQYEEIKLEILGEDDESDPEDQGAAAAAAFQEPDEQQETQDVRNLTGDEVKALRRSIYLTINNNLQHDAAAHKLLKGPCEGYTNGDHLAAMLIDACAMSRTYVRYHGLLAERFCLLNRNYQEAFENEFAHQYSMVYNYDTPKIRNIARLFGHILQTDALPWEVLRHIKLNENDTTAGSRIFIKILLLELAELVGLAKVCKSSS